MPFSFPFSFKKTGPRSLLCQSLVSLPQVFLSDCSCRRVTLSEEPSSKENKCFTSSSAGSVFLTETITWRSSSTDMFVSSDNIGITIGIKLVYGASFYFFTLSASFNVSSGFSKFFSYYRYNTVLLGWLFLNVFSNFQIRMRFEFLVNN